MSQLPIWLGQSEQLLAQGETDHALSIQYDAQANFHHEAVAKSWEIA